MAATVSVGVGGALHGSSRQEHAVALVAATTQCEYRWITGFLRSILESPAALRLRVAVPRPKAVDPVLCARAPFARKFVALLAGAV